MTALHQNTDVARCAAQLAAGVRDDHLAFDAVRQHAATDYLALLEAVKNSHPRFAFDRDGRPGAIGAVREALPVMERDLFEAVLEDHACEVAAIEEALFQFALALARARK
jgi:hypothetical protein